MKYLLIVPLTMLLGCADKKDVAPVPPLITPVLTVGPALYRVTLNATWNTATDTNFPSGAHFSPLIGLSHRTGAALFEEGQLASLGIKNMAEVGNNAALRTEIAAMRGNGVAFGLLDGHTHTLAPGTLIDTIRLDATHPRLTVVTMIAPSPDWFAALENVNLLVDGKWVDYLSVPAVGYDAGTDSGSTYIATNEATVPAQPIRPLLLPGTGGVPVATWQLERLK